MILLFEGMLNSDDLEIAHILYYEIYIMKEGRKARSTKPEELLEFFTKYACDCQFRDARKGDEGENYIVLSSKDKEAINDLCNMVTPAGGLYMSVKV